MISANQVILCVLCVISEILTFAGISKFSDPTIIVSRSYMSLIRQLGVVAVLLLFGAGSSLAQERIVFGAESTLVIEGTSNKSDWSVSADSLSGWVELSIDSDGVPSIHGVELRVVVKKMSGGRGPIMDRLMLRALKANEYKEIVYELLRAETTRVEGVSPDSFSVVTKGNLTIAGETRQIEMIVGVRASGVGTMVFRGSHALKMSDFGMKPPTALFGALHTKDDVVVHFEMVVEHD